MANILVVDDELGIRDLLWEILNDEGHNVEVAENAAQARAARLRERPDLVLLDIWMPDTDGVTLLQGLEIYLGRHGGCVDRQRVGLRHQQPPPSLAGVHERKPHLHPHG